MTDYSINSSFAIELKKLKIPKVGNSSSSGMSLNDTKTQFTKIFFESALEYMEAQYHLFNALEMNDEAGKTRKSIDFVKNTKNKEGKRLTNAFNSVSDKTCVFSDFNSSLLFSTFVLLQDINPNAKQMSNKQFFFIINFL